MLKKIFLKGVLEYWNNGIILQHFISSFCLFFYLNISILRAQQVEKLSIDMLMRTLHEGKSITVKGEVFYRTNGLMVTHFTYPYEQVSITNINGEFKHYDVKSNTVVLSQGLDLSSKNSFFYNFLTGAINDLGLQNFGYTIKDTRIESKMVITTWLPPAEIPGPIKKVELVHENQLPIFMGFYDAKGKALHKVYYSSFQPVGQIQMPFSITEFQYLSEKDSVISKRTYSNLKINSQVSEQYFNFVIPSNAKVAPLTEKF